MKFDNLPDYALILDPSTLANIQAVVRAKENLAAAIYDHAWELPCIPIIGQRCLIRTELVEFTGEVSGTALVPICERDGAECPGTCHAFVDHLNGKSHYYSVLACWDPPKVEGED